MNACIIGMAEFGLEMSSESPFPANSWPGESPQKTGICSRAVLTLFILSKMFTHLFNTSHSLATHETEHEQPAVSPIVAIREMPPSREFRTSPTPRIRKVMLRRDMTCHGLPVTAFRS